MPSRVSLNKTGPAVRAAGWAAVAVLAILGALPRRAVLRFLRLPLLLYPLIRPGHALRLRERFTASPFFGLDLGAYYRVRLELLLRAVQEHGREPALEDIRVEGWEHYTGALESGRPVALVGLHLGVVELLHRVPTAPKGRPFLILTASAFSSPLTEYMAKGRERDGKRVLMNRNTGTGLREVLRKNGVLALMADQAPVGTGYHLELWDSLRVPYPARLLYLLLAHRVLLVPVSTRLEADGRCRYRFHPAWTDLPAQPQETALAARLRGFLEEAVAWAPEQWNWSYPGISLASLP